MHTLIYGHTISRNSVLIEMTGQQGLGIQMLMVNYAHLQLLHPKPQLIDTISGQSRGQADVIPVGTTWSDDLKAQEHLLIMRTTGTTNSSPEHAKLMRKLVYSLLRALL